MRALRHIGLALATAAVYAGCWTPARALVLCVACAGFSAGCSHQQWREFWADPPGPTDLQSDPQQYSTNGTGPSNEPLFDRRALDAGAAAADRATDDQSAAERVVRAVVGDNETETRP